MPNKEQASSDIYNAKTRDLKHRVEDLIDLVAVSGCEVDGSRC